MGERFHHEKHGDGTVVNVGISTGGLPEDEGLQEVTMKFDSGEEHTYKYHSLHKLRAFKLGGRYHHEKHGDGTATKVAVLEGEGHPEVTIKFDCGEEHTYKYHSQHKLKPNIELPASAACCAVEEAAGRAAEAAAPPHVDQRVRQRQNRLKSAAVAAVGG